MCARHTRDVCGFARTILYRQPCTVPWYSTCSLQICAASTQYSTVGALLVHASLRINMRIKPVTCYLPIPRTGYSCRVFLNEIKDERSNDDHTSYKNSDDILRSRNY